MPRFTFEIVDDNASGQCSLVLDAQGIPSIAYAAAGGSLMLARRNSRAWVREELMSAGRTGRSDVERVCLDLDSNGNPHIVYKDLQTAFLVYGARQNGSWTFRQVPTRLDRRDPGSVKGYDFRLHFRPDTPELQNTPHLVFHDLSTGQLGYARLLGGEFKVLTADTGDTEVSRTGLWPSMVFDRTSGTFAIAYIKERPPADDAPPPLVPNTTVWTRSVLDPLSGDLSDSLTLDQGAFSVSRPTSIAVDSYLCVAYADATHNQLIASVHEPGTTGQTREVVATTVNPVVPSVAQTFHGEHRIAYGDDNKLKLASHDDSGSWRVEVVDAEGGAMPSLAYDRLHPKGHIAYLAGTALKYVTWTD